jgi:ABC-type branched-subunit amino acid transport system ATPase component
VNEGGLVILLEVSGLTKHFGGLVAVSEVDMYINEGEIVGLIGLNGAGKTTFFNLIQLPPAVTKHIFYRSL